MNKNDVSYPDGDTEMSLWDFLGSLPERHETTRSKWPRSQSHHVEDSCLGGSSHLHCTLMNQSKMYAWITEFLGSFVIMAET